MPVSPGSDTDERRRTRRHFVRGPVDFHVLSWYPQRGSLLNLGMNGCLIRPHLSSGCNVGDLLEIRFAVKGLSFRAQCVVRRVSAEDLLGIELTRISERNRTQLLHLLEELADDKL